MGGRPSRAPSLLPLACAASPEGSALCRWHSSTALAPTFWRLLALIVSRGPAAGPGHAAADVLREATKLSSRVCFFARMFHRGEVHNPFGRKAMRGGIGVQKFSAYVGD